MAGTKDDVCRAPAEALDPEFDDAIDDTGRRAATHDEEQEVLLSNDVTSAFRQAVVDLRGDILEALRAQWTPRAVAALHRYAEQRARLVRQSGRPCPRPTHYARELVHDAYVDTWSGELAWDHRRCALITHLCTAIKTRTRKEIEKSARHVSLDTKAVNENQGDVGTATFADRFFSSSGDVSAAIMPALVARMCEELTQAIEHDQSCMGIVRAWRQGLVERDEIMEATGLDAEGYGRARRRLLYACADLSGDLRELVHDHLRSE